MPIWLSGVLFDCYVIIFWVSVEIIFSTTILLFRTDENSRIVGKSLPAYRCDSINIKTSSN
jgi:hypothetical protein